MKKRIISLLLAIVVMASVLVVPASAATAKKTTSKKKTLTYKVVTSLGDSGASGYGLPDYQEDGRLVQYGHRITGSYPDLVAKKVKAETLYPYAVSGNRTWELRYLLDPTFYADDILKNSMPVLSDGQINEKTLKKLRPKYIKAVKEADLILLDTGFDDMWVPTIATIYDIASHGRYHGEDPDVTMQQLVKKYGSYRTVVYNALSYLIGFASTPLKWADFWVEWDEAILKWLTDYQRNYNAIVSRIYELNPDVTVVTMGFYNPIVNWDIIPNDKAWEHAVQPYYDLLNATKKKFVGIYDNYYFVDERDVEVINNTATLPMLENLSMDDSGFNPHPNEEGHKTIANRIIKVLKNASK